MKFALPILACALTAILTARPALAETLTQPAVPVALPSPAAAPATCAQSGATTLVGRVPMPRKGQNVSLQIAPDTVETEALAKDMIAEVEAMKPLEKHMSSFKDYSETLAQIPAPQPSSSDRTLTGVEAVLAQQAAHQQLTTAAVNELSPVQVGAKGDFACRGVPAGTYIFLLRESEVIPTNGAQQMWGTNLPNETLYQLRFVVPKAPKAAPFQLRTPFTMVARFQPVGA